MQISDVTNLPLNFEASRVESLIPSQLRGEAQTFIRFMEEYYTFMNQPGNPSYVISSANEQHDLDQVSDEYVENLRALLAPYVPYNIYSSVIKDKRRFFRLLVRYFYNERGSRQSIKDFFRIFYNDEAEIVENFDGSVLLADTFVGDSQDMISSWYPYSYGISTGIPISQWRIPYKALVHPLGWKFFAYLVIVSEGLNSWGAQNRMEINYDSPAVSDWFYTPEFDQELYAGAHSPTSQPSSIYKTILTFDFYMEEQSVSLRGSDILLTIGMGTEGHLVMTKRDFVNNLKCLDESPANLHEFLTFASTEEPFSYSLINDFMNVSSEVIIT